GWMVPGAHYLESWGDARAYDGTLSVVQPLIEPMYGGKTASEVLAALLGDGAARAHDLLRADWARRGETDGSWRSALGRGVVSNTSSARVAASFAFSKPVASPSQHTGLEIVFAVDGRVHDGRFGNNAWLQELPDPITTLTWGNAAHLSGATAARLGVANGDVVRLRTASSSIEIVGGGAARAATQTVACPLALPATIRAPRWTGAEPMGDDDRSFGVHRLRRLRCGVSGGEQRSGGRRGRRAQGARDALAAHRPLCRGRGRRYGHAGVHLAADALSAVREGAVRVCLPGGGDGAQPGWAERD